MKESKFHIFSDALVQEFEKHLNFSPVSQEGGAQQIHEKMIISLRERWKCEADAGTPPFVYIYVGFFWKLRKHPFRFEVVFHPRPSDSSLFVFSIRSRPNSGLVWYSFTFKKSSFIFIFLIFVVPGKLKKIVFFILQIGVSRF